MKNLTLILGGIILLLNSIIGLIFSSYKPFNIGLNTGVIIVNTLMLYILGVSKIKDGFKISLSFLFLIAAVMEFVTAFLVSESFENNVALTILILLFACQVILYVIAFIMTNDVFFRLAFKLIS